MSKGMQWKVTSSSSRVPWKNDFKYVNVMCFAMIDLITFPSWKKLCWFWCSLHAFICSFLFIYDLNYDHFIRCIFVDFTSIAVLIVLFVYMRFLVEEFKSKLFIYLLRFLKRVIHSWFDEIYLAKIELIGLIYVFSVLEMKFLHYFILSQIILVITPCLSCEEENIWTDKYV